MKINILEYLEETATRLPDKPAFIGPEEGRALTFGRLLRMARGVGSCLIGSQKTGPVAVFMDKEPETAAAFFGVMYSGGFYVPLDAEMPMNRLTMILENLKPSAVICGRKTAEPARGLNYDGDILLFEDICEYNIDARCLEDVRRRHIDVDPAYVVFTSGSTGTPKGVVASHRSVIDYIEQLTRVLKTDEETVFGSQTPLYVDACLKELISVIKCGASAYFIPKSLFMFPVRLLEYLNEKRINTVCWVVSALTMISGLGALEKRRPEHLTTVAFGSEVFPVKQFKMWREALPDARFINLYGPTEATGMSCFYEVTRELSDNEPIPIGEPFPNTRVILIDGEICIAGAGLSLGYYNDPEKTGRSFIANPNITGYREIIYRTGDLGRYNEHGELVYISRKDYQIKHMGQRIELAEIEAAAQAVPDVAQAACVYDERDSAICLFYSGQARKEALIKALKSALPRYMLPAKIERLEQMPLTPNMKLDRKALLDRI
ncbi:MAG: amino acid adenylation domain-containing protein [Clostridiales bacterium]|jgi:amino acid adenylation domain-containing protein|nr:amino acid adenylation domain-containing protein [Clostridiales bacterium]